MPEAQAPATFTVAGFKIAATAAGIKKNGLDLGLLYSDHPATTAAVFTKNAFPAAPILVTREHLVRCPFVRLQRRQLASPILRRHPPPAPPSPFFFLMHKTAYLM